MTIEPLGPRLLPAWDDANADVPLAASGAASAPASFLGRDGFGADFARAVDAAGAAFARADSAERDFSSGRGGLQEMVLERAQADVALSLVSAAASRASQSLSTILGMQV